MSAEGSVPPEDSPATERVRHRGRARSSVAAVALAAVFAAACSDPAPYVVSSRKAPDSAHTAVVRLARCGAAWCQSLWVGATPDSATLVATLPHDSLGASEIAWSRDGKRVGFVVDGYQLRLYDAVTSAQAGQLDLVPADSKPTTRIARGVTFSDNGAAITFDDCPRDRSGCRPGLVALR